MPTTTSGMPLEPRSAWPVHALERLFDRAFGELSNPIRQLGAIGYFLFWVICVSGIYVYVFYDTSVDGAWRSMHALERDQPWAGGLMRSLHRYASDAFIVVVVLHLLREWLLGRFKGFRWFTWVTGVPLLWLMIASGIVGFWLVWDQLAAWVALATLEWTAALPGVGGGLVRNVAISENVSDRMFSLLIFVHIGVSLLVLLGMWIHVQRLAAAVTQPTRRLAVGLLATLALLALVRPAPLHAPADILRTNLPLALDWFYLAPLAFGSASPVATWVVVAGLTVLLAALPWLTGASRPAAARVDLANCNGCGRCFEDCPYGAVVMVARNDGRTHPLQAHLDSHLCASCGICAGACPSSTPFRSAETLVSGIDMPQRPVQQLRLEMNAALGGLSGDARTLVFACERGADARSLAGPGVAVLPLTCSGQLAPAFVDYGLRHGADGIVITGCSTVDCEFRFGATWTRERLLGRREPRLRATVDGLRLTLLAANRGEEATLARQVEAFRQTLRERRTSDPDSERQHVEHAQHG